MLCSVKFVEAAVSLGLVAAGGEGGKQAKEEMARQCKVGMPRKA